MEHHNLAVLRGERKNAALEEPDVVRYRDLYNYFQRLWAPREANRYGSIVEPMTQWVNTRPEAAYTQVVPCRAGILNAVVYANGDVAVCENHEPIGNLRDMSFPEMWNSPKVTALRQRIAARECHCTNVVWLWPSVVYQPYHLLRALIGAKVWRKASPLTESERAACAVRPQTGQVLVNITQAGGKA
jgi:hypothetical protein